MRNVGCNPRASSRSSASADRTSSEASSSVATSSASGAPFACCCAIRSASDRFTRRCCAPSWRSRSRRRRSASAAVTMRALEARTSSSCTRTSACRRWFSRVSLAAAPTDDTSSYSSRSDESKISAASGSPSPSPAITVATRSVPSEGSGQGRPSASTYACRSGSQYASSNVGSRSDRANASRKFGPDSPAPSSTTRSPTANRSNRARRRPTRKPMGSAATARSDRPVDDPASTSYEAAPDTADQVRFTVRPSSE